MSVTTHYDKLVANFFSGVLILEERGSHRLSVGRLGKIENIQ